jgi:hypothetical protein
MAETETPEVQPLRVISTEVLKGEGIRAVIEMLTRDHAHFDGILAIAVVATEDPGINDCVVYTTNLNFLEKLGLLEKAKVTIQNGI